MQGLSEQPGKDNQIDFALMVGRPKGMLQALAKVHLRDVDIDAMCDLDQKVDVSTDVLHVSLKFPQHPRLLSCLDQTRCRQPDVDETETDVRQLGVSR